MEHSSWRLPLTRAFGATSPRTRGEVKESACGDAHPHPPCRGVMISISSPAFSRVSAQRLFGTTS